MILAAVAGLLVGLGIGYVIGLWSQSRDEILDDHPRSPDYEPIIRARWERHDSDKDMTFIRAARMIDPDCETVHRMPLSEILVQSDSPSQKAQRQAERVFVDAVKIERTTGRVVSAIFRRGPTARALSPVLRKAGIKVVIDPQMPL